MKQTNRPVAPESGTPPLDLQELLADPAIAALLDFEPAVLRKRVNGWTAEAQRGFVAALAATGSKHYAVTAVGRTTAGIDRVLKRDDAAGLRAAVEAAFAHAAGKHGALLARNVAGVVAAAPVARPGGRPSGDRVQLLPLPGQVMNELGEWEDEDSYYQRGEEAKNSIARKLLRVRRLYLSEIAQSPGKRAAFEILTELPIDWDKAARMEPQADEPYNIANQRQPDMILCAESGWTFGEIGYGPDRKAELRQAIDDYRAEHDMPSIDWEEESADG